MLALIPVLLVAFSGLVSAGAAPANVTSLEVGSTEDIWGAPSSGKVTPRSVNKRKGPNSPRLLNCHGVMQIKDDEPWPWSDDYFNKIRDIQFILGVSNVNAQTYNWVEKVGGEIRIEVLLTAVLNPNTGSITLSHKTKLFEGTSTSTGDLDGKGQGSKVIARNAQQPLGITVHNTDEGGDWVKATLTCTNGKVR